MWLFRWYVEVTGSWIGFYLKQAWPQIHVQHLLPCSHGQPHNIFSVVNGPEWQSAVVLATRIVFLVVINLSGLWWCCKFNGAFLALVHQAYLCWLKRVFVLLGTLLKDSLILRFELLLPYETCRLPPTVLMMWAVCALRWSDCAAKTLFDMTVSTIDMLTTTTHRCEIALLQCKSLETAGSTETCNDASVVGTGRDWALELFKVT